MKIFFLLLLLLLFFPSPLIASEDTMHIALPITVSTNEDEVEVIRLNVFELPTMSSTSGNVSIADGAGMIISGAPNASIYNKYADALINGSGDFSIQLGNTMLSSPTEIRGTLIPNISADDIPNNVNQAGFDISANIVKEWLELNSASVDFELANSGGVVGLVDFYLMFTVNHQLKTSTGDNLSPDLSGLLDYIYGEEDDSGTRIQRTPPIWLSLTSNFKTENGSNPQRFNEVYGIVIEALTNSNMSNDVAYSDSGIDEIFDGDSSLVEEALKLLGIVPETMDTSINEWLRLWSRLYYLQSKGFTIKGIPQIVSPSQAAGELGEQVNIGDLVDAAIEVASAIPNSSDPKQWFVYLTNMHKVLADTTLRDYEDGSHYALTIQPYREFFTTGSPSGLVVDKLNQAINSIHLSSERVLQNLGIQTVSPNSDAPPISVVIGEILQMYTSSNDDERLEHLLQYIQSLILILRADEELDIEEERFIFANVLRSETIISTASQFTRSGAFGIEQVYEKPEVVAFGMSLNYMSNNFAFTPIDTDNEAMVFLALQALQELPSKMYSPTPIDTRENRLLTLADRINLSYRLMRAGIDPPIGDEVPSNELLKSNAMDAFLTLSSSFPLTPEHYDTAFSIRPSYNTTGVFVETINSARSYVLLVNTIQEMEATSDFFISIFQPLVSALSSETSVSAVLEFMNNESMETRSIHSALRWLGEYKRAIDMMYGLSSSFDYTIQVHVNGEFIESIESWHNNFRIKTDNLERIAQRLWNQPPTSGWHISLAELYILLRDAGFDLSAFYQVGNIDSSKPLSRFFNEKENFISQELQAGIRQSASFIPLRTNVFAPNTYIDVDLPTFQDFHEVWGFYRKAVFIDTGTHAATEYFNTNGMGALRVATLRDMLEHGNADIVLYSDHTFYNVHILAELQGKTYNRLDGQEGSQQSTVNPLTWFWNSLKEIFTLEVGELVKTGKYVRYSTALRNITDYPNAHWEDSEGILPKIPHTRDHAVFGRDLIQEQLNWTDEETLIYSPVQSFAVVSSIYRDKPLLKWINDYPPREPIFISSQFVVNEFSAGLREFNAYINHAIVRNLPAMRTLSFETNLDLDNPLFLDIYGNIITESGLVVIPAASNATLNRHYNFLNAGFLTTYGKEFKIPGNVSRPNGHNVNRFAYFTNREERTQQELEFWEISALNLNNRVDLVSLSFGDVETLAMLRNMWSRQFDQLGVTNVRSHEEFFSVGLYIRQILLEVMRGAPLEFIDRDLAGINPIRRLSVTGIVAAVRLEQFIMAIRNNEFSNFLHIPNPAFIPGVEYVILYIYKLFVLVAVVMVMWQIALGALQGKPPFRMLAHITLTIVSLIALIYIIPLTFEVSYYWANRLLLQKECQRILMFNLERREQGIELGMISALPPANDSVLLLKLRDIHIPWHTLFRDIIFSDVGESLAHIYERHAMIDTATQGSEFQVKNDGIYIDAFKLIDASSINLNPVMHTLQQRSRNAASSSFFIPYYFFLDLIIQDVNVYNAHTGIYAYSTALFQGGRIKSLGLIENYFMSDMFLEQNLTDIFGLRTLYGMRQGRPLIHMQESDIDNLYRSQWFNDNLESDLEILNRIELVENYALEWIIENRHLIGRVSDETFLRLYALSVSMYHNKVFQIGSAETFELYNLNPEDLIRVATASGRVVMESAPYNFARFVYSASGQAGVLASAFLLLIVEFGNSFRSLVSVLIMLLVFISLFVFKLILEREKQALQGYINTMMVLMMLNFSYALMVRLVMNLPLMYVTPFISLVIQAILHLVLICIYVAFVIWVVKNWRDLGGKEFQNFFDSVIHKVSVSGNSLVKVTNDTLNTVAKTSSKAMGKLNPWELYNKYKKSDKARESLPGGRNSTRNPFKWPGDKDQ